MFVPHPKVTWHKEAASAAFAEAVGAVAGFTMTTRARDIDSVDVQFEGRLKGALFQAQQLDVQLKCTAHPDVRGDALSFPLPRKNFADLSARASVARILVVMVVPSDAPGRWCEVQDASMIFRCRAYWCTVKPDAAALAADTQKIPVLLPRSQRFTPDALERLMQLIADGGMP